MQCQWSISLVSILLFVVCVSVIKCSSANRVENNTGLLKNNFQREEKQHHETRKGENPKPQNESTNSLTFNSEGDQLGLENARRRLHSIPVAPNEYNISDGIKYQDTNKPFLKPPAQRQKVPKRTRFYILNRRLSKSLPSTVVKTPPQTPEEYILHDQDRVFVLRTKKSYEKSHTEKRDVIPTKCNGTTVHYTPDEYMIMVNSSIYVKKASRLHNYGEYKILSNKSVTICHRDHYGIITNARQTIRHNEALGYITFIFFVFSILFLIFLLVTYILFPQLRTLPGKNLMNFAASLLLFQVFWLPSSFPEVRSDKPTCKAMAIVEHYFLMASFFSMSVIAFHTWKVFASLPAPKISQGHERKLFCMYLALVWILPAVFVGICVVLDHQDILNIGYGESEICWLTESNAYTYFVTIPIAILLLFNVIAFVVAAVYLRKHSQNKAAKQASGKRRSNLSIYVKLSTLMGFTWLFGLLALVVTSTTVFWYFFVIFTSLQGVFVALAFVGNAKTFNLYKQRFLTGPNTPNATRNIATNISNDTRL